MSFGDACLYSVTGLLVVFFALFLLMIIIKLMTVIGDAAENRKKQANRTPAFLFRFFGFFKILIFIIFRFFILYIFIRRLPTTIVTHFK